MTDEDTPRPTLRIIRGDATAEEIAALLAAVAARTDARTAPPAGRPVSAWSNRAALARRAVRPGPGAWQASAWPR